MTIPSRSPYSSTTIAMCWFVRRNSVSSAARSFVSGTMCAGRSSCSSWTPRDPAVDERREEVAHVEDADDRRRASRGRPGSACTATRSPPRAPPRAAARSRARPPRAAAPSRPRPPCRRSRRPCRASPAPAARSRPARSSGETSIFSSASEWTAVLAARRLDAERAQRQLARALEDPDQRLEDDEEAAHRRRDGERGPLRVAQRDALRHELADDDVEERDDQECEGKRRSPWRGTDRRPARAPARRGRRSPGWSRSRRAASPR